jgi:hypothetical protein
MQAGQDLTANERAYHQAGMYLHAQLNNLDQPGCSSSPHPAYSSGCKARLMVQGFLLRTASSGYWSCSHASCW